MKIKKLSHCCLVIDIGTGPKAKRILLDPGSYSVEQHRKIHNADVILITHEHGDHFHIESLKELIKVDPKVKVITNDVVGEILVKEGIEHHIMEHGNVIEIDKDETGEKIKIQAYGKDHAIMHSSIKPASNIGYLISYTDNSQSKAFFFPGDAFTIPSDDSGTSRNIDVLALPVSGPWMKISEAVDYALTIKPRIAFPVHDAIRFSSAHMIPEMVLGKNGIEFIKLEEGGSIEVK